MAIGLIGKKCGMTRIFSEDGVSTAVTVVEVYPNKVAGLRTEEKDGYSAIRVTAGAVKNAKVTKPQAGEFAAAGVEAGKGICEFRVDDAAELGQYEVGSTVSVDLFEVGQYVDVRGVSKGKGFAGAVKRWNFRTQDATHGNSLAHRAPGSIGQNQTPGRVFKGKKMAGRMGGKQVTVQTLEIVRVDAEKGLLLIKGAVPGASGGSVVVLPAVKRG